MSEQSDRRHDPGAEPEEEGIPDLQDGTPEAQRAGDPQRMPVPGDEPAAAESWGTTFSEQVEGEPLEQKLDEEEPEPDPRTVAAGPPAPEAGQLSDDPLPERPANQDVFSSGSPVEGAAAEESAVHVSEDDERDLGLRLEEDRDLDAGEGTVSGEPREEPPE
jgi:hypothetical protein